LKFTLKHIVTVILLFQFSGTVLSQDSLQIYNSRIRIVKSDPDNPDIKLVRTINNSRSGFLDKSLTVTDYSVLPVAVILPASMIAYSRVKKKNYDENTGILLALSEVSNAVLTTGIKYIVKRPRPYITLKNVNLKKGILADPYSFPSGHTGTAFSMATALVLRYPKYPQVYIPAYLWGLIVGYGRIYFGMHYPTDVLGGAVLGSVTAVGIYSLRKEIFKAKNKILGEENKPDENNIDSKSIGIISTSFLLTICLNEFFPDMFDRLLLEFEPLSKNTSTGITCQITYSF
jgi:membrane-associated phospholipid phosphatase